MGVLYDRPTLSFKFSFPYSPSYFLVLNDGSIVSCSADTARRWFWSSTNSHGNIYSDQQDKEEPVRLVGTFKGHSGHIMNVVESDNETIITSSQDRTLREWNKTTGECLRTSRPTSSPFVSLLKTRDSHSTILCGTEDAGVHFRRTSDLNTITFSFKLCEPIYNIIQLEDGSFVGGSRSILQWDDRGRVLRTYSGEFSSLHKLVELNSDRIVTCVFSFSVVDRYKLMVWSVSTGECVQTFVCGGYQAGLVKLSNHLFASAGYYKKMKVWSITEGKLIQTIHTLNETATMARLKNGSIVLVGDERISVFHRRWY